MSCDDLEINKWWWSMVLWSASLVFSLVTNSIFTLQRRFSIVFPTPSLWSRLKKFFSTSFTTCFLFSILEAILSLHHGDCKKKTIHGELWKGSYQVPGKVLNFGGVEGSFPCQPIRNQFFHETFFEVQNSLDFLAVVRNHV